MRIENKTVYLGLSGGVDSSVAAALLQKEGYNCIGVYMKTWEAPGEKCTWREDRRDAMRVCAKLDIPFKTWDFTKQYKTKVVDYMIKEYSIGRTPNPDIMCNKEIKFGLFFDKAIKEGADYVATGHYARVRKGIRGYKLLKGKDGNKDQTYFLWTLGQKHLARALFPIGEFKTKKEIRNIARKYSLSTAEKKDSQGVCFIGPIDIDKFLRKYIPSKSGPIVSVSGRKLGEHDGLPFYTIGQRQGIGVGGTGPYYVVRKEEKTNTLIVAPPAYEEELLQKSVLINEVNFIGEKLKKVIKVEAAVRYRQKPMKASIKEHKLGIMIEFKEPVKAVTPGQSAVFYNDDELLGGGIIS